MQLGVQTHFSQGWNTALISKLKDLGVTEIRDSQPWSGVEKTPGVYNFTSSLTRYMDQAENAGVAALLTFASANTLYDSGFTPYTAQGRQAYANYIVAVLQKYGSQVQEIEIWNEFNTGNFTGPADANDAYYYTELLKTVWNTVKPLFPDVKILGGSVNVIGVGALESIFKLGALNYMDAVAVHPYRSNPEHVDDELTHLQEVMAKYGAVKPIYATEFGNQFENAADVPDFLLKMVTLMSSAHVAEAYWYALIDQSYYKNMGLYTTAGEAKPGAAAFAFIEKELLSHGDPVRIDTGDDMTLVYRFGADTYVMWSAGRNVSFGAGGHFYNAMGQEIAAPTSLTMTPVIFRGSAYSLGESTVVADSLMQFNEGEWQYFAKDKAGHLTALTNVDWDWTSYLGSKYTKPLRVNADSIAPAGDGTNPIQVVERYVSDRDQKIRIDGTWTTGSTSDGVDLHVLINGVEVLAKVFSGTYAINGYTITLKAGDTLDFAMGPNQTVTGDSTSRHITLTRVIDAPPVVVPPVIPPVVAPPVVIAPVVVAPVVPPAPVVSTPVVATPVVTTPVVTTPVVTAPVVTTPVVSPPVVTPTVVTPPVVTPPVVVAPVEVAPVVTPPVVIAPVVAPPVIAPPIVVPPVVVAPVVTVVTPPTVTTTVTPIVSLDLVGSADGDTLTGGAGADRLRGLAGDDRLIGGAGDDILFGGDGKNVIDGGDGYDTVSYEDSSVGVKVRLGTTGFQYPSSDRADQLVSVEAVIGSAFKDSFYGNESSQGFSGGAGDDTFYVSGGTDTVDGGAGVDLLSFASWTRGVDFSLAITGTQSIGGGDTLQVTSIERVAGSAFDDRLTASEAGSELDGGSGNDVLVSGAGDDQLIGGKLGSDTASYELAHAGVQLNLTLTAAQATGGGGTDTLSGIENLMGSAFDDELIGSKDANIINGGAGNDVITGGAGMDRLTGGSGADTFNFVATSDSRSGAYDTITDFSHADGDRINLGLIDANTRAAGNQAFVLADHFTNAAGQLVITAEAGGYLVEGDVNGDGIADFGVHVVAAAPLVGGDFYL